MDRLLRSLTLLASVLTGGVALWLPALRRPDGWLQPQVSLWLAAAVALVITGVSLRRTWQRTGYLLATAVLAQACMLQLVFSPPYDIYQHFRGFAAIVADWRAGCLGAVMVHGLLMAWLYRRQVAADWRSLRDLLAPWQYALLLMLLCYAGVLVSTDGLQYGFGVLLVAWTGLAGALNLLLAVRALPATTLDRLREYSRHWLEGPGCERRNRALPWLAALWVLVVSGLIAALVNERLPHISDSIAYLFQAKHFSAGLWYLPPPPDAASFHLAHFVNTDGKWYSFGFPGWPAVLTLGVLAGAPWLVNPLLGAASVLLAHALIRRMYGIAMAHGVVLLLALSPWYLYSSANFMGHTLSLLLALGALLLIDDARHGAVLLRGLAVGALLGLLALTRPLEGILMSLVCGLRILGVGGTRAPLHIVFAIAPAAILVGGLIFPYSQLLTGDPLYPPHLKWAEATWYPGVDRLGFGPDIGNVGWPHHDPLPGHSPLNAVLNGNKNAYAAGFELFGWSFGSLPFVMLAFLFGRWSRRDWLFWATVFIIILGNSLHWSPGGPDFAARYWYQAIVAFALLTLVGARQLANRLADNGWYGRTGMRTGLFIVFASLCGFSTLMPWRAIEKYHHYRGMFDDFAQLARDHGFAQGALVYVHARAQDDERDYASGFVFNPPTLDGTDSIYVRWIDAATATRLEQAFPGRPVWHVGIPEGQWQVPQVLPDPRSAPAQSP